LGANYQYKQFLVKKIQYGKLSSKTKLAIFQCKAYPTVITIHATTQSRKNQGKTLKICFFAGGVGGFPKKAFLDQKTALAFSVLRFYR
jgi:hypothetical protein